MEPAHFILAHQGHVSSVIINRPQKANSLNLEAWKELPLIFQLLNERSATRVIILRGNEKHFCAGMDLEALMSIQQFTTQEDHGKRSEAIRKFIIGLQASVTAIEACDKPVIAAIGGACMGAGVDIIAACDIRLCSSNAYFSIKEIDLGMVADMGTLQRLPKIMPPGWVAQLAYTGEKISGTQAQQIGLVNNCYSDFESLTEAANTLAKTIGEKSPQSIRGTKQMLLYARDHSVADSLKMMSVWNSAHLISNDLMEAFQGTMAKRKPEFED